MGNSASLSNTMYDILKVMGKDAEFLYDTIDKYTDDAEKENKKELANTWRKIKSDRLNHINLLKEALEKEIHGG
jgi:rubrerythrin